MFSLYVTSIVLLSTSNVPPIVLQFMLCLSPVVVQSITEQQLDNNWTTSGQQWEVNRRYLWVAPGVYMRCDWDVLEVLMRWTGDGCERTRFILSLSSPCYSCWGFNPLSMPCYLLNDGAKIAIFFHPSKQNGSFILQYCIAFIFPSSSYNTRARAKCDVKVRD